MDGIALTQVVPLQIIRAGTHLPEDITIPTLTKIEGAAGFDIFSAVTARIRPGQRETIATGVSFMIPAGYGLQIISRPGLASARGVVVMGSPIIYNSGFTNELKIGLGNLGGKADFNINKGDPIAIGVLIPIASLTMELVE